MPFWYNYEYKCFACSEFGKFISYKCYSCKMDLHVTCAVPMLFKVDVKKLILTMGPWGGTGNKWDDGIYSTVRRLLMDYGEAIVSLRIEYDNEGHSKWGAKQGAKSTFNREGTGLVDLHYPNEYLTSVHGYIDNLYETECVRSLTFQRKKDVRTIWG
ncbi:jacalin-related lectin 3 isoform X2 [Ricinus communis]|uniref:jacalin-related lectin 3 isoform X2 n=1 Tax=Ricinus communis TaxID=3988 RepID=UPI00201AD4D6|nr:jacalin-related lectin 3 isoform X2 [Ricinus communis]